MVFSSFCLPTITDESPEKNDCVGETGSVMTSEPGSEMFYLDGSGVVLHALFNLFSELCNNLMTYISQKT